MLSADSSLIHTYFGNFHTVFLNSKTFFRGVETEGPEAVLPQVAAFSV